LEIVSTNPSNPRFCYYLFEAIGAVIRFTSSAERLGVENSLYTPFASIVENDVQDFLPYIFQLFAALLEGGPADAIPNQYTALIPIILRAEYWLSKGNVPALVRLLSEMLRRAAPEFVSGNQVEPVLGIFQQLFASKANELQAFELLESILLYFNP
jgi:exportin-2 (importin alpha re-exporter)